MYLAFVDFVYHYDASRPDRDEPLGGTTSAVCFLARALVKTGISCIFFNRVGERREAEGIITLPLQELGQEIERGYLSAYIFCGRWTEELVNLVRAHTKVPLIAWMHESALVSPMTPALDAFDGIVFVSEWQKQMCQRATKDHWKQSVIRNAMNPLIPQSQQRASNVLKQKTQPPILLFAGSFARGAFHIPPILERVRKMRTDFTVEMFCNLDPSRDPAKDTLYVEWLRALPNVTHLGMVGQPELVRRMQKASILLAPNPWPETSCIALIEGLASGLDAVLTARAALPETASGFGRQIHIERADETMSFDMPVDYDAFALRVCEALDQRETQSTVLEAELEEQVSYFQLHYQWAQRVTPWLDFIGSFD